MNRFAALLDRLAYEPRRLGKLALLETYFRETPDPDRGWALAAMTGALSFKHAKPAMVRDLAAERTDPVLLGLSCDFVGDMAETIALMWEPREDVRANAELSLSDVVDGLQTIPKAELPARVAEWLDRLDENGRWALIKLITGALRIGVSARLARTALARLGGREADEIEDVWHADAPPYLKLFAWLEGRGENAGVGGSRAFLSADAGASDRAGGVRGARSGGLLRRVEMGRHPRAGRRRQGERRDARDAALLAHRRRYLSGAFPDLTAAFDFDAVLDGELLVRRGGAVQDFNTLQQGSTARV